MQRRHNKPRGRIRAPGASPRPKSIERPGAFLLHHERLLVANALANGLARARGRSSPERVAAEAAGFVRLLAAAMDGAGFRDRATREVSQGAFAGAGAEEVAGVCAVWERAVAGFALEAADGALSSGLERALRQLTERVTDLARRREDDRIDVVALGASAGGITALSELLAGLEAELPATLLLVMHVSPRVPSLLPSLLARHARLAIASPADGASLYLGFVYVAPPGRHLVAAADGLHLVDGPPVHFVKPSVDVLFESAAETFGRRLCSVVLTGTGADGATGSRAVHEHGGVTLAQDPQAAEFRGMPDAAVATGAIDRTAPLPRLIGLLQRLVLEGRSALHG